MKGRGKRKRKEWENKGKEEYVDREMNGKGREKEGIVERKREGGKEGKGNEKNEKGRELGKCKRRENDEREKWNSASEDKQT